MSGAYKAIKNTYDARWNLCREIDECGKVGSPTMATLMFYFTLSAWWGDKYGRKEQGQVDPKYGNPKAIEQYTGVKRSAVYEALGYLEDDGWVSTLTRGGEFFVTVRLDAAARKERAIIREKLPHCGNNFHIAERRSTMRKTSPQCGLATVSDLRKHAVRNLGT